MKKFLLVILALKSAFSIGTDTLESTKELKILKQFSKKMKTEKTIILRSYRFRCIGSDKVYDGKIHALDLGYSIDKNLNYKEARKLFYELADSLIQEFNAHQEISDLFYHYPIGYEDLDLSLSFDYESKGHLKKENVDSIFTSNGSIVYYIVENEKPQKMITNKIAPDIYILDKFEDNRRKIAKNFPETD